ncbi:MAG: DUF4388 domain-containing protein [Ktedonobacterales bacterium]|nr:DUF4388 domain-containing protein [Ktedonobacterales bacterium]
MAKPRVTATDRLSNVIEVVELGRRTGLLSVERGVGTVLEEGEIFFMVGRAIYAAVASLRGREALAVLTRWGECRFAFDPYAPRPTPNVSGVLPSLDMVEGARGGRTAPGGSMPSGPSGAPTESSGSWRLPPSPPPYTTSTPGEPIGPRGAPPAYSQPTNPNLGRREGPADGMYGASQVLMRRPRRAPDVRDLMAIVTTYNLSRGHRTILLLADGEHTILDLARLSSKSVDEVSQLLTELEGYGLVYYYA